jgi:hypothetical protein
MNSRFFVCFSMMALSSFMMSAIETTAQTITPIARGQVAISCPSGRTAVASMKGTIIMVTVREPNGKTFNTAIMPSGGSSDPEVAMGKGSGLANEVCGL